MHKSAMKCNETLSKWCKNKHGALKIIDTFETYHISHRDVDEHAVFIAAQNNSNRMLAKNKMEI
jgi:hypothetical protein